MESNQTTLFKPTEKCSFRCAVNFWLFAYIFCIVMSDTYFNFWYLIFILVDVSQLGWFLPMYILSSSICFTIGIFSHSSLFFRIWMFKIEFLMLFIFRDEQIMDYDSMIWEMCVRIFICTYEMMIISVTDLCILSELKLNKYLLVRALLLHVNTYEIFSWDNHKSLKKSYTELNLAQLIENVHTTEYCLVE